jgi:hypothetical protein
MAKVTVRNGEAGEFVRTNELITGAEAKWPLEARCALLSLSGDGLALSIQLSEAALEQLVRSGGWVLAERDRKRTATIPPQVPGSLRAVCG